MALPTALTANTLRYAQSGIVVGMTPSTGTPRFGIELQISTQSSTASTAWQSVFLNPTSAQYIYTFLAPLSTRSFSFRARHFLTGYSNGPFTGTVSAKPGLLPEIIQPLTPLLNNKSNVEIAGGDIWLSSGKTAKVGTQQSAGTITKTIRFSADTFIPLTNVSSTAVASISRGIGTLTLQVSTKRVSLNALYVMPKGSVITKYSARGRRGSTAAKNEIQFYAISTAGAATSLVTLTFNSGVVQTLNSTTLSQTVSDANYFIARSTMKASTGAATQPQLLYTEIEYKMPSYDKQY